ncbi:MAG: LOG family protein [Candidatus Babeliales bacterium]|jgi:hypothetical protein
MNQDPQNNSPLNQGPLSRNIHNIRLSYHHSCAKMMWMTFVSIFQILYAHLTLRKIKKPIVTFFGGHQLPGSSLPYGQAAEEIAYRLAKCDMMIMTGGGGGIMQKALDGTIRAQKETGEKMCIGISVQGLNEGAKNQQSFYLSYITMRTFFARKWVLMSFSHVFFFFPGGFGMLDEFMEIMTLLKTSKLDKRKIVLYGSEYWKGFFAWASREMIERGFSDRIEMDYFVLVDSVEEAAVQLKTCCGCR